jgi:hypothetical protein
VDLGVAGVGSDSLSRRRPRARRRALAQWLLTVYFAPVHAAGREVANGASTGSKAERSLLPTLLGAFGAPAH